jgi:hypothetical protein
LKKADMIDDDALAAVIAAATALLQPHPTPPATPVARWRFANRLPAPDARTARDTGSRNSLWKTSGRIV